MDPHQANLWSEDFKHLNQYSARKGMSGACTQRSCSPHSLALEPDFSDQARAGGWGWPRLMSRWTTSWLLTRDLLAHLGCGLRDFGGGHCGPLTSTEDRHSCRAEMGMEGRGEVMERGCCLDSGDSRASWQAQT